MAITKKSFGGKKNKSAINTTKQKYVLLYFTYNLAITSHIIFCRTIIKLKTLSVKLKTNFVF